MKVGIFAMARCKELIRFRASVSRHAGNGHNLQIWLARPGTNAGTPRDLRILLALLQSVALG